jgi:ribosome-associated protein
VKLNQAESLDLARLCCRALDEKKAGDLRVIDVSAFSSITNLLVIATATSEPHVRALRVELEKALDSSKTQIVGVETASESGWTVMDAFDVMVHIFTAETRARYRLEHLWRDGDEISVENLLAGNVRKVPPKAKAPKAGATKGKTARPKAAKIKVVRKTPAKRRTRSR